MGKRSGKFYIKNEKQFLGSFGLKPTAASGSGWIEKEDGESEHFIVQLKSTDAESIRINKLDIEKLEYHASVSKKIPMFIVQFLKDNSSYVMINTNDMMAFCKSLDESSDLKLVEGVIPDVQVETVEVKGKVIKSGKRGGFYKELERKYKKM